jgi:hypothetical protein
MTQYSKAVTVEIRGNLAVEALGESNEEDQHVEDQHTEEQVVAAFKQHQTGDQMADICLKPWPASAYSEVS